MITRVVGTTKVTLIVGDITLQGTDAIVNAANSSLMGGGGVDGAIHRVGGPAILEECKRIIETIGSLEPGLAVGTTAGNMRSRYVIHTVGPMWIDGNHDEGSVLYSAYRSCLNVAMGYGLKTVSFPAISTGVYRYPLQDAADMALAAVYGFLQNEDCFDEIVFVLFTDQIYEVYEAALLGLTEPLG